MIAHKLHSTSYSTVSSLYYVQLVLSTPCSPYARTIKWKQPKKYYFEVRKIWRDWNPERERSLRSKQQLYILRRPVVLLHFPVYCESENNAIRTAYDAVDHGIDLRLQVGSLQSAGYTSLHFEGHLLCRRVTATCKELIFLKSAFQYAVPLRTFLIIGRALPNIMNKTPQKSWNVLQWKRLPQNASESIKESPLENQFLFSSCQYTCWRPMNC